MSDDVLAEFESAIAAAELDAVGSAVPWRRAHDGSIRYAPNLDLLRDLLTGPIRDGASTQSGRLAKAFDAWMSYELRRAAFDPAEVWPRNEAPRVWSRNLIALSDAVAKLRDVVAALDEAADLKAQRAEKAGKTDALEALAQRLSADHKRREALHRRRVDRHAQKTAEAIATGEEPPPPPAALELPDRVAVRADLPSKLRQAINGVSTSMPHQSATNILGRFYVKQVDVMVSSWDRGADVLISGKTMFSSFAKNMKNRYEETLGEASNLRDRYPLASMGYAFVVSDAIFGETGTYARLQDLLLRTRKPDGPYDATMLLIATWDEQAGALTLSDTLTHPLVADQVPTVDLSASRFFTDLLNTVIENTPVGIHQPVREARNGTAAPGGAPDLAADAEAAEDGGLDAGDY